VVEAGERSQLVIADQRFLPAIAGAAIVISQNRAAAMREIAGEAAVDLARHGGGGIDQDGMPLGPAGQEQRRPEQISVRCGKGDVVDENVVQPGPCHRDFPPVVARVQQTRIRL
jgi:hypothetical protein